MSLQFPCGSVIPSLDGLVPFVTIHSAPCSQKWSRFVKLKAVTRIQMKPLT